MPSLGPDFIHVFRTPNGELRVASRMAHKTMDKRHERSPHPEVVWEITQESGLILRLWPEDVLGWDMEEV